MKIVFLNHYYLEFARAWYAAHPGLSSGSYAEQRASFDSSMFGGMASEIAALRRLGHDAEVVIVNLRPAQEAWAREHAVRLDGSARVAWRLRRGVVPWPNRQVDEGWVGQALLAQIEAIRPDVVHVQCMDSLDPALIPEIRRRTQLVTGQIAAPLPLDRALAGYDLLVSSLPNFVARFREVGISSEWLPLAFDPSIAERIGVMDRTVRVSFVGSLFSTHRERLGFLEAVASAVPIDVWTSDAASLAEGSPLRAHLHPAVWGEPMYQVLASSEITLNVHIDIAEEYANNLRLYEATGMGALLLTDAKTNLAQLFEPESEVVTYRSAAECTEKIAYYLEHRDEARLVADRGRARTLRDHTWLDRMQRLVGMFEARL